MKRLTALLLALLCLLGVPGCAPRQEERVVSRSGFALNTFVTVSLYGDYDGDLAQAAVDLCASYEAVFSRTDPGSELCRLNAGELAEVSGELLEVISLSLSYARLSQGALDPTMGALSDLWQFTAQEPHVPAPEDIAGALSATGYGRVEVDGDRVSLPQGCRLDLGAVAKGYIADRVKDFLLQEGVASAVIDLGGNLYCLGLKPDGSPFSVGVQYPYQDRNVVIATLEAADLAVVTSGVYERCFEEEGVLYHHILDPATGYPARNSLLSVTIAAPSAAAADALSTACFVLGLERGMALADSLDGVFALFVTDDFALHPSAGMEESCGLKVS